MFRVEWLICCLNLARSSAIPSPSIFDRNYERDSAEFLDSPSLQFSEILSKALEESSSTWPDLQDVIENPLSGLTRLAAQPEIANPMVPLNTPLGELMVPFSSLFSKGLRMLFDMFKDQQLPISQADLTVLTTSLNDLAVPATTKMDDRESPPSARVEPPAPVLGITFRTPTELTKKLTNAEMPVVLIGVDDDESRMIRSDEFEPKELEATDGNRIAKAIATVGLASVWAEMEDRDFMNSLALLDTSGVHENLKYADSALENNLSPMEIKDTLIKDLLATTTDTLPWLPLDGIVKTLPKFLVERMGKTGELLGTLASYWKSGAETIDNVAGGILKPVLSNIQSNNEEEEDYTGRNGFVENVNVPDEDVSMSRKIVTGAGIPPRQQASSQISSYVQYPTPDTLTRAYYGNPMRARRALWEESRPLPESSSELFDSVQKASEDVWQWSDFDEDWEAPPFVSDISSGPLSSSEDFMMIGSSGGFSRSSFDLDPFGIDYYKHSLSEPEWDLRTERYTPSNSYKGKHKSTEHNDDHRNKLALADKLHLLDRLHEQHAKKSAHRNRNDESPSRAAEDLTPPGPVSIIRDFVKSRQDTIRAIKDGPSAIERFRAERLGREKLLVGDDFDDEDELFDDEEDDDRSVIAPKHERVSKRRESAKTAPARDLSEWDYEYYEAPLPSYDRNFLDSNGGGSNLIGNVISSFIGGGEPDVLTPAMNLMNAAAAASNPLSGINNGNAALYENLKASVQRQKDQLDEYLEQMAGMYNQVGPEAEASAAAMAQESAREADRAKLMEEVAQKVSEELSNSMKEAEAQRAEDNNKLWEELEKERQVLEQLLGDDATLSPLKKGSEEERRPIVQSPPASSGRVQVIPPPVAESADHEFYPVNAPTNKLATIQDVINQMIGSISRLAPPRRLSIMTELTDFRDDELGEVPYEAAEVIPQIDFADWYDVTDEWAGMRSGLVSQIASSVNDVSKTVHNNPISDIVQSLIEGIVDANPLSDDRSGGASDEIKDVENGSSGGVQERLAQSAASMLRQISNKVIKSGPRIKSNALDLELKQPDPDPIKKSEYKSPWWF